MSYHGSFTSASQLGSGSGLESPVVQFREPLGSPKTHNELTVPGTTSARIRRGSGRARNHTASPYMALARWSLTDPCESSSSRMSRPKCVSTAEIFGHLPGYSHYARPSPPEDDDDDDEIDDDEDTPTQDVLSPLKERRRRKLRETAGVRPKPSRKHVVGASNLKPKTSLPPAGTMRCLWGNDCTTRMAFDYSLGTIKDWKGHIAVHLTGSNQPAEDPGGRGQKVKMVRCSWDGCGEKVEKGYLFKHIVTHEVRFKLLCPRGCEVAIRDDNLERHLKSCRLGD